MKNEAAIAPLFIASSPRLHRAYLRRYAATYTARRSGVRVRKLLGVRGWSETKYASTRGALTRVAVWACLIRLIIYTFRSKISFDILYYLKWPHLFYILCTKTQLFVWQFTHLEVRYRLTVLACTTNYNFVCSGC